jgi:hypothetical protein
MAVHIRPVDFDLVDELIASGDLDGSVRSKIATFTLENTALEWDVSNGFGCTK